MPIDGEYGLEYQFFIMRRMLEQLPKPTSTHLLDQLGKIEAAASAKDSILTDLIRPALDDLRLSLKALQFDLEATRQERDELRKRLG